MLKRVPWDKLAILPDLDYLISGAQVHSWRETSWIGKGGGVISSIHSPDTLRSSGSFISL